MGRQGLLADAIWLYNINLQVWNTSDITTIASLWFKPSSHEEYDTAMMIRLGLISCKVDLAELASQCPDPASPMSMQWIIGSWNADGCDVMATTCFGPQVTQHCSGKNNVLRALSCSPNRLSPCNTVFLLDLVRTARLHVGSKELSSGSAGTSKSSFLGV